MLINCKERIFYDVHASYYTKHSFGYLNNRYHGKGHLEISET